MAPRKRVLGQPGAQTWGWLVVYTDPRYRTASWGRNLRVHEYTHVVQGFIGGPLFALAYGLTFLYHWVVLGVCGKGWGWYQAYLAIPFERHARRVAWAHPEGWGA